MAAISGRVDGHIWSVGIECEPEVIPKNVGVDMVWT